MENLVIAGQITATSNKVSGDFKSEQPTKTVYFITDPKFDLLLQDFGLTRYTSKEDGKPFYIVKMAQNVAIYATGKANEQPEKMSGLVTDGPNIKTADGVTVKMNLIKGEKTGNVFYRLQAILITGSGDIQEIEQENPFA